MTLNVPLCSDCMISVGSLGSEMESLFAHVCEQLRERDALEALPCSDGHSFPFSWTQFILSSGVTPLSKLMVLYSIQAGGYQLQGATFGYWK